MRSQNSEIRSFRNPRMVLVGSLLTFKDCHGILDDDDDDDDDDGDDLNTCNPFTMIKILHDNSNPLNDQEHDHEDYVINAEYYSLINRVKNEYIEKC